MTILQEILAHKRDEVRSNKELYPIKLLERSTYFTSQTVSLKKYLQRSDLLGIIAEIKRKSPSKGYINRYISVEELSIGYMQAGASALSVLTDEKYFGGSAQDLRLARQANFCPILRKEFIVDEYQIVEAKAIGADVILLIAAALTPAQVASFSAFARSFGLEVLLEVHTKEELASHLCDSVDLVGINNRDLHTFTIDVRNSLEIGALVPPGMIKISESGLDDAATVVRLKQAGFNGFLIGEAFLKSAKPDQACGMFIEAIRQGLHVVNGSAGQREAQPSAQTEFVAKKTVT